MGITLKMSSCFEISLEPYFSIQEIMLLYYVSIRVFNFCDFDLKFDISWACMYSDFYKIYAMINSDLHASRADFELNYTNASMHLVSFSYGSLYALS